MNANFSQLDVSKVSVIVPICKRYLNLMRCLDTIRSQTYKNIEIICIETLGDKEISSLLSSYEAKDKRIQILTLPNAKVEAARNAAIRAASGGWIIGVDAGDCLGPRCIERALGMTTEEVDIVCFGIRRFSEWRQVDKGWKLGRKQGVEPVGRYSFNAVSPTFQGKMWRTSLIHNHGVQFAEGLLFSDESFVYPALTLARKIAFIPEVLYARLEYKSRVYSEFCSMNEDQFVDGRALLKHCMSFMMSRIPSGDSAHCSTVSMALLSFLIKPLLNFPNHQMHSDVRAEICLFIEESGLTSQLPSFAEVALYYHQPLSAWAELKRQIQETSDKPQPDTGLLHDIHLLLNEKRIYRTYRRVKFLSKVTFGKRRAKYKEKTYHFKALVRRCRDLHRIDS